MAEENRNILNGHATGEEVGRKRVPEHVGIAGQVGLLKHTPQRALPVCNG